MGYFKEQLDKVRKNNIDILEVHCAQAVDHSIAELSDKEFETITDYVYDWVIRSHIAPEDIVLVISNGLGDGDIEKEMFFNSKGIAFIEDYISNRV